MRSNVPNSFTNRVENKEFVRYSPDPDQLSIAIDIFKIGVESCMGAIDDDVRTRNSLGRKQQ